MRDFAIRQGELVDQRAMFLVNEGDWEETWIWKPTQGAQALTLGPQGFLTSRGEVYRTLNSVVASDPALSPEARRAGTFGAEDRPLSDAACPLAPAETPGTAGTRRGRRNPPELKWRLEVAARPDLGPRQAPAPGGWSLRGMPRRHVVNHHTCGHGDAELLGAGNVVTGGGAVGACGGGVGSFRAGAVQGGRIGARGIRKPGGWPAPSFDGLVRAGLRGPESRAPQRRARPDLAGGRYLGPRGDRGAACHPSQRPRG
jgi:hypothetical protein